MLNIKGIIFDFDGTLFDSMSIWETAGEDYLASLGITAEKDLRKTLNVMSLMQAAQYLKEHYCPEKSVEEIMDGVNKTVENFYFHHAMPKDNVIPFLKALKEKGIKMCIATATDRYQVEAALKRCDMLEFFDSIFTCTEVGSGKDEPHIYDCACKYMGFDKSETAVFEDAYHAAYTAKNAGYFVAGVYDKYERRTDRLKKLADLYLSDYSAWFWKEIF